MIAPLEVRGVRWLVPEGWHDGPVTLQGDRIVRLGGHPDATPVSLERESLVALPGLVNGHDHLDFGGFPLMARKAPYADYVAWAEDVTARRKAGSLRHHEEAPLPRRLLHSALRNLRSGVTAVAHMNPLAPRVFGNPAYPLRVLGEGRFFHSLAFGGDLARFLVKVKDQTFALHVAEGTSERARQEIFALRDAGALRPRTVLVHGTALDEQGARLVASCGATLVLCLRSNETLYGALPPIDMLRRLGVRLALGSDSPISGPGDLLEDLSSARRAGLPHAEAWRAVTETPARAFGAPELGVLAAGAAADIVLADAADPCLEHGRASVIAVLSRGRPVLARRPGIIAAFAIEERESGDGLWLERGLHRWCQRGGIGTPSAPRSHATSMTSAPLRRRPAGS